MRARQIAPRLAHVRVLKGGPAGYARQLRSTAAGPIWSAEMLAMAPKAAQIGHIAEERITQNLTKGFSLTKSASAMYLALSSAARIANDEQTAELAAELAGEEEAAAEKFWRSSPSRSKIAYNVLTAGGQITLLRPVPRTIV